MTRPDMGHWVWHQGKCNTVLCHFACWAIRWMTSLKLYHYEDSGKVNRLQNVEKCMSSSPGKQSITPLVRSTHCTILLSVYGRAYINELTLLLWMAAFCSVKENQAFTLIKMLNVSISYCQIYRRRLRIYKERRAGRGEKINVIIGSHCYSGCSRSFVLRTNEFVLNNYKAIEKMNCLDSYSRYWRHSIIFYWIAMYTL